MEQKGLTLIELIVVMAVFLLIIGAVIGMFISVVQNQRRVLQEQQLLNQISYVEERMSKALRMAKAAVTESDLDCLGQSNFGYIYLLTRYDAASGLYRGVKFLNQSDVDANGNAACQEFFLDNTTDSANPVLKELKDGGSDSSAAPITSSNLKINSAKFAINGSDGSASGCTDINQCGASRWDDVQPRITLLLDVQGIIIQTTVSQRNLNVQ